MNNTLPTKIGPSTTINASLQTGETATTGVETMPSPRRRTDGIDLKTTNPITRQIEQDEKGYSDLEEQVLEKQKTIGERIDLLAHYQTLIQGSLRAQGAIGDKETSNFDKEVGKLKTSFAQQGKRIDDLKTWFEQENRKLDGLLAAHTIENSGEIATINS